MPSSTPHDMEHHIASNAPSVRILTILAERQCEEEDLYPEDRDVPEFTVVQVPAHLDDKTAAAAALGAFHSSVPVKRTWDFDFSVIDAMTFKELAPDYELSLFETAQRFSAKVL